MSAEEVIRRLRVLVESPALPPEDRACVAYVFGEWIKEQRRAERAGHVIGPNRQVAQ